ncbi:3-dehydroquinate synthase [Radiobacillus sp. PE A8.2]|uniref:3-dehydroquinate synthase n=1 Tax=Radiobacillus sp. PE A8.2 TaxID=3380349 RepID=UPI0038905011
MQAISITTSSNKYEVSVGTGLRLNIGTFLTKQYSSILIVTDSTVAPLYLLDVKNGFENPDKVFETIVPAGEASKSQTVYFDLITKAIEFGLDRQSLIIALGGGMIGDLAGFVASTYMRGIDFIQVPTSILAHDSSVGGKVGINHPEGKNLIGSFYPPQAVIYDVEMLTTLPEQEKRSGYAEIVKHGLISDQAFFTSVIDTNIMSNLTDQLLTEHLVKGINVKATIVEQDEKESNVRKYLNLGHTLGHAIEAELGYGKITHGEAVAIGMLFALRVSESFYKISLPYDQLNEWLQTNDYPLQIEQLDQQSLLQRMKKDKKSTQQKVQMVLLRKIGEPTVEFVEDGFLVQQLDNFFSELVI